jgi:hypothetical protein
MLTPYAAFYGNKQLNGFTPGCKPRQVIDDPGREYPTNVVVMGRCWTICGFLCLVLFSLRKTLSLNQTKRDAVAEFR